MALSRGMTALRAALGAVGGGLEGYAQMQELERRRKKEEEAANMQRDLFRLQLIQASGGRLAPPTEPVRAAAPAAPAMTMPSTDTVLQRALARTQTQEFGPMATPATQAALEPGRRQALGMETPPLARTSLGELLDRQTGRLGMAGAMPTPMAEAAPAPVRLTSQPPAMPTPTRRRETLGGMEFEVIPGDTPEEKAKRELDLYRRQKEIDVQVAGQKAKTEAEAAKALKDQRIQTLMDAGMERKDAIKAVELEAKYGDVVVTPSAQLSAATTRRGQDITARGQTLSYMAAMGRPTGGKAGAQAEGGVVLPSITEAINNFKSITPDQLRKISSYGVSAASTGQQQGGFAELGLTGAGSLLGVIGDAEKRYAQQAGAIADAVARASEVGVLTNFDINRFRSQILFSPGDSEKIKQEKLARAVAWGEWMASNKKAVESGQFDRITATPESTAQYQISPRKPGESVEAYLARTGGR